MHKSTQGKKSTLEEINSFCIAYLGFKERFYNQGKQWKMIQKSENLYKNSRSK